MDIYEKVARSAGLHRAQIKQLAKGDWELSGKFQPQGPVITEADRRMIKLYAEERKRAEAGNYRAVWVRAIWGEGEMAAFQVMAALTAGDWHVSHKTAEGQEEKEFPKFGAAIRQTEAWRGSGSTQRPEGLTTTASGIPLHIFQ